MWQHFVLSRIWRNLDNKDIESDRNRISEELLKLGGRPKISIFRGGGLALREGNQKIFIFRGRERVCLIRGIFFRGGLYPSAYYVGGGRGWQPIKNLSKFGRMVKVSYCGLGQACRRQVTVSRDTQLLQHVFLILCHFFFLVAILHKLFSTN